MKNKTYSKNYRKKSLASFFLALLLTLSFNSSPIMLMTDSLRSANAYKATDSQTYYSKTDSSEEKNFGDANFPESLSKYFEGSNRNFNIRQYYLDNYESILREKADAFFDNYSVGDYQTQLEHFLTFFGLDPETDGLSDLYVKEKDNFIKLNFETPSYQTFIERLATEGFHKYDTVNAKSILPITNEIQMVDKLSDFYRMLANYVRSESELVDDAEHPNRKITSFDAFYKTNTHYIRLKTYIDNLISAKAPTFAFDGETQDTNIAAIFAKEAPNIVEYNYKANSYDKYTVPSATYSTFTKKLSETLSETKNYVYYFGSSDLSSLDTYKQYYDDVTAAKYKSEYSNNSDYFQLKTPEEKEAVNILFYRLVQDGEFGYLGEDIPTYYKYSGSNTPYIKTNSSLTSVYVLDDTPTQSDIDTIDSVFFNHITTEMLTNESNFYIPIPYEKDELYFTAVYGNLLHSKKAFDYETFKTYFRNGDGSSKLYFKLGATELRDVYIDSSKLTSFKTDYPDYQYIDKLKTFTKDSSFKLEDYELILANNVGNGYLPKTVAGKPTYELYFAKEKVFYYEDATTSTYGDFEKTYAPIINLEQQKIASIDYEPIDEHSTERKIYVLDESKTEISLNSITYPCIKQADIDANSNFFVAVPTSLYPANVDSETYKLYYKHAYVYANKIYVVDNADNAENNQIYKTLNYNVIGSKELEDNYSNYLVISDGDANYNKNFQLYYKYARTPIETTFYILKEDVENNPNLEHTDYKTVGGGELTDYVMLDKTAKAIEYEQVMSALNITDIDKIHLYYKLSDVFVQNSLTNKNAIYVIDSSLSSSEKEDYMQNGYTAIEQKDVDNNKNLYVLISEKDPHYRNDSKLKLYYRYNQSSTATNTVYTFDSIDTTASDYDKNAYVLIQSGQAGYKAGAENYYKKTLVSTTKTEKYDTPSYYYYQTSKTVALTADSYYAISFYVQTIGDDTRASFYIKDTTKVISDIKLENINTAGEWQQYYVFISTNVNTASTINLYLYLGDEEHGIVGDSGKTELTGSIFFDDIKVTKIGLTDYNKHAINDKLVYSTALTTGEGDAKTEVAGAYADEYNNRIYIANLESKKTTDARFTSNVYDFKNYLDASNDAFANNWNNMFDFDADNATLKNLLGYDSNVENSTLIENTLADIGENIDGKNMYDSSFTSLWRYYLDRDLKTEFALDQYRQAYNNDKLEVSITNKIEKPEEPEKDDEDDNADDKEEEDNDIVYVSSPFKEDNYALKLTNNHKDISLGITSNAFTVKQFEYYKISLWIYSPNLEGTATISVNSVLKTRQSPTYGSLLSSSIESTYANVEDSASKNAEYGWIPVTLFIEGNNYEDMQCYLVLSADADCTVYFDNIRIEKTTSAKFDDASSNSSSNKYTCALSLTPSSSISSTDVKNGSFDFVKETNIDHNAASIEPYAPDNWTTMTSSSKRVIAGVVSTKQTAFFDEYADGVIPTEVSPEYSDLHSNIYAIYAPKQVTALDETTKLNYLHTYSIYSGSLSLSANSMYKLSFKFYKGADFDGNLFSNIYLSSVKEANIVATLEVNDSEIKSGWQTYTYYIATGTSSSTAYIEIGVKEASGISYVKSVTSKKLTGKTMNGIIADVAKENGIDNSSTEDIYNKLKDVRFLSMSDINFSYHTPETNDKTNLFDQSLFANKAEASTTNTVGQNGVAVATYFDTNYTTTHSVTINKINYYIGEVYTLTISDNEYFVHKTYNSEKNVFEYTMYSDDALTNKVTKIDGEDVTIDVTDGVKVKVGSNAPLETTTTYRLYRFSDLREEVRVIDGSPVSVPSLDKVIVGVGSNKTESKATSSQVASYEYHFGSSAKKDFVINNTIIPASELNNAQSADVLILSNSYSTDYITLSQSSTKTLGKSSYNILKIYVKTSDFASDNFGLNITVKAVNAEWKNINTTKSDKKDQFGFVCYEVLIQSNSSDSISDFGVQFSLGDKENTGAGYAIISKVSLTTLSSADEFEHYSELVGDENENIKKAIYDEKTKTEKTEEDEKADDENSVSWATFFYIFSSLLLVITMAVALIAIIFKKHPVKFAQKYSNEHERDIEPAKAKSSKKKNMRKDVVIGELDTETRPNKDNGGIE